MSNLSLANIAPVNSVLFQYYSANPTSSAQTLSSEFSHCTCYISLTIALQTPVNGHLYIDYYTNNNLPFHIEDIPITNAPVATSFIRSIETNLVRVRLVLDTSPEGQGALGLFCTLRKKYA